MSDERLNHDLESPWTGEHYFRYEEVLKYVGENDRVLDIACGEGYGTHKIALQTKNQVFGGDVSASAIDECKKKWNAENLEFRIMDGTKLDFESNYFNKVVSFETIEHTTEYRIMLEELNRVLKADGTAYISTPNILVNSPNGYVENPYHTQEWQLHELQEILAVSFDSVKIFGQKYSRYDDGSVSWLGKGVETILSQRVVRRLPIGFKNQVSHAVTGRRFYPQSDDFSLVSNEKEIVRCQTFFCICTKKMDSYQ